MVLLLNSLDADSRIYAGVVIRPFAFSMWYTLLSEIKIFCSSVIFTESPGVKVPGDRAPLQKPVAFVLRESSSIAGWFFSSDLIRLALSAPRHGTICKKCFLYMPNPFRVWFTPSAERSTSWMISCFSDGDSLI